MLKSNFVDLNLCDLCNRKHIGHIDLWDVRNTGHYLSVTLILIVKYKRDKM